MFFKYLLILYLLMDTYFLKSMIHYCQNPLSFENISPAIATSALTFINNKIMKSLIIDAKNDKILFYKS